MTSLQEYQNKAKRKRHPVKYKERHHRIETKVEYVIKKPSQPNKQENSFSNKVMLKMPSC